MGTVYQDTPCLQQVPTRKLADWEARVPVDNVGGGVGQLVGGGAGQQHHGGRHLPGGELPCPGRLPLQRTRSPKVEEVLLSAARELFARVEREWLGSPLFDGAVNFKHGMCASV